jgi:DNA-binding transcriptional regulator GbsR (MarR family)
LEDNEVLAKTRSMVIDTIAQNMNLYGITPSAGRLYGLLFYSDKPLTLDEMKEELGMSKTSMSNSVRSLLDLNMVEKVWVKGERKDLYTIKEDWYQCFFDYFTIKWRTAITTNSSAMEKSLKKLQELIADPNTSEDIREQALRDVKKLNERIDYYDWQDRLIDTFETKEILNFVPVEKENDKRSGR